jgi:DNA polymerase II large subunit
MAENAAERVAGLISVAAPALDTDSIAKRILSLEEEYGKLDWRIACKIALETAQGKHGTFKDSREAMEVGIRVGFAYVTLGVVSAPIEGLTELELKKTRGGKSYFALHFAGPIRNAGGTAASVAVIIADYVRINMGYAAYDPDTEEIARASTELSDYHTRITNLQYNPSTEETHHLVGHLPIEITGPGSERIEVSNYKDLPRVPTNRLRSGFCLMLSSCLALKAPKLWKQLASWGEAFSLGHWNFLEEFLAIQKSKHSQEETPKEKDPRVLPNYTYVQDTVGGRPILAYPMRPGGFRLRYGHGRVNGYSAQSIHPAAMEVLDGFIATATQAKVERPGKATAYTVCDSIEPPIVRLKNGDVIKVHTTKQAKSLKESVEEILFLGDVLINYGDFLDRAHMLVPTGYCPEWWEKEIEKSGTEPKYPTTYQEAVAMTVESIPIHPDYTYYWSLISSGQAKALHEAICAGEESKTGGWSIANRHTTKEALEAMGCEHKALSEGLLMLERQDADILKGLFMNKKPIDIGADMAAKDGLAYVSAIATYPLRNKAGTFIGSRMGRPEKAKMRKMKTSPHGLFSVGTEGGKGHLLQECLDKGEIMTEAPIYYCASCKRKSPYGVCHKCGGQAERRCMLPSGELISYGHEGTPYVKQRIPIREIFEDTMKRLDQKSFPETIRGVEKMIGPQKDMEHIAKGMLRAAHDLAVNKDGTIRYDASEVPVTHFKPKEIATTVKRLHELGYTHDIKGETLSSDEQVVELLPQDVILPACPDAPDRRADDILLASTQFIDALLKGLYSVEEYYKYNNTDDLVGCLVVGLAPHTSAGIIGRIIGRSKTQGMYCHPYFHAAMRRDADGDESCFMLLLDALLNFSKTYLPERRGSTMDAPLVITSCLDPSEVDDMVFNIDRCWSYPLEFYEAAAECKMPWEVAIPTIKSVIGKREQFEGIGFTHDTTDINDGVLCSQYKLIPSMQEKVAAQMRLAEKIRAVDAADVARIVIETHFLKDTKGNLRRFSQQTFRCVQCNRKYARPPLLNRCSCGGKLTFTVAEGSVTKYLEPSIQLAKKYGLSTYLQQTLALLKSQTESVFGKEEQTTLQQS